MRLLFMVAPCNILHLRCIHARPVGSLLPLVVTLLWGTGIFLLGGCPASTQPTSTPTSQQRPASPATSGVTTEQRQAFDAAKALRASGRETQALQAFRDFVRRYPSSALTDKALLALGALSAQRGNRMQAEGYYRSLLENFPFSPHTAEAHLERGVLFYQSQDYARSLTSLQQSLAKTTSRQEQAKAHYYLGAIARQRQQYPEALTELIIAVDTSFDTRLVQQAQTDIAAIIHDHLIDAELIQLSQQYAETYPGDLILARLARGYREKDNVMEETAVWQRFIAAFQDHPDAALVRARLQDLQAMLTTEPNKIGVLLPLSGEGRIAGERALWGIELALATLRQRHPALELTLVIRDSQGTSSVAKNLLRALVNEAHVIGVIGPLFSQVAVDLAPLAEELAVPLISPYARDSRFPFLSTYAFRNSITDAMQGRFLAQYARYTLNLRRFAILYPDEPYGKALKDMFIEHIIELQGEVVAVASYAPDATDFRQPIKRIGGVEDETLRDLLAGADIRTDTTSGKAAPVAEKPVKVYDAIFLPGYYDTVGLIAPELAFYNITGVQLLGVDGWNDPKLITIGERFVEDGIFVDGFFINASSPAVSTFVDHYQARYGERPNLLAAQAYDTLELVAQGLLQSGAKTRPQLRDTLLQVRNFPGVSGTTSIDSNGNAEKILYLLTIQGGRIVQLN